MAIGKGVGSDEDQIGELINHWAKALRAKDLDGIMSHYAADIVCFDIAPPLQSVGTEALRKNLKDWFATFNGPIGYEIADLAITASDRAGFGRSLNRLSGMRSDGEKTDVWLRMTLCCRKTQGQWMIVHEHASVPFYMDGSDRAAVDLAP
jgi:ketosteroid isomerase-like protein